ncbi:unnamed protein product [Ascophyllum nodosum]
MVFGRRKSYRASKEIAGPTFSSSSSDPAAGGALLGVPPGQTQHLLPLPSAPPAHVEKKNETNSMPANPAEPASILPADTKRVLVVGKYVVMTADVENCDAVIVQGNLDGEIHSKRIVIMKGGCVRGKVECEEADVSGSFEGMNMTVHRRLTLSASARVGGTITYNRLSIQDGAILTGELIYKPVQRESDPPSVVATGPLSPAEDDLQDPDDVDADLSEDDQKEKEQGDSVSTTVWNAGALPALPAQDVEPSETQ